MHNLYILLYYELQRHLRRPSSVILSVMFFVFSFLIFFISLEQGLLHRLIPQLIWSLFIFATTVSLVSTLHSEKLGYIMEVIFQSQNSLMTYLIVNILSTWLVVIVPLSSMGVFFLYCFGFENVEYQWFIFLLGGLSLVTIGNITILLTESAHNKTILSIFLMFPFYLPILLGGLGYMTSMGADKSVIVPLLFLGGLFFIYLPIMISIGVCLLQIKIRSI